MKLYYKPGACSLSPHIVLRETGIDFTLVRVDLATKKTEQGEDYLTINPKGQIPALQLPEGTLLTEGVAIVQYLADLKSDRQLLAPCGSLNRYHTIEWLTYTATELHKSFIPLFRPNTSDDIRQLTRKQLEKKFSWIDQQLEGKQWIMGLRFTVADAYLYTVTRWAYGLELDMSRMSALKAWFDRVAKRPAVVAALKAEGLL